MSNYTKSTNFATKDNLTPGDPLKVVRGTEIDTEFNNIATAVATKTDNASAAITGGTITGITDLAVADGGTGASTATAAINNLLPSQTSNANKYLQTDGTNVSWDAVSLSTSDITGTLPVANGGTGVTSSTGTGSVVLSNSPTLVTPALGTPASGTATNLTGLPISTGVSGLGTGVATFLATPSSANLISAVTDETGTGSLVFATSPTLVTPALGTPSALVGTNITGTASGLTAGNVTTNANLTGAVTSVGNATSLGSFSSANLLGALTDETGTGSAVFATSPTLVTPILGTPTSATLTNATGLPIATGVSGLGTGVATALAVNTGSSGAPVINGGALGTPSGGTLTNATGLPLTTGVTGTLPTANGGTNLTSFTSGGVVYASSSSALATGSDLTFSGGNLSTTGQMLIDNNKYIGFKNTTGTYAASIFNDTSNFLNLYNSGNTGTIFYVNAAEQMRLTSGGLGLGTTSTATKAVIYVPSSTVPVLTLGGADGLGKVTGVRIGYGEGGSYTKSAVMFENTGGGNGLGSLALCVNTVADSSNATISDAKLTINSSGNVGIGTSSPAYKLDLYTTAQFSGRWGNATRAGHFYADSGGPGIFNTAAYGGEGMYFHAGSNYIQFITNSNENMRLDSAGGLKTKNTIGVGDATPSSSGAGITFPATQSASSNANTLDDYEEGTWTAELRGATTRATTPVTTTGTYTKVGRLVTVYASFSVVDTTGATGAIQVTGAPFTATTSVAIGSCASSNIAGVTLVPQILGSGTTIEFSTSGSPANYPNITAASGIILWITLTYIS